MGSFEKLEGHGAVAEEQGHHHWKHRGSHLGCWVYRCPGQPTSSQRYNTWFRNALSNILIFIFTHYISFAGHHIKNPFNGMKWVTQYHGTSPPLHWLMIVVCFYTSFYMFFYLFVYIHLYFLINWLDLNPIRWHLFILTGLLLQLIFIHPIIWTFIPTFLNYGHQKNSYYTTWAWFPNCYFNCCIYLYFSTIFMY